MYEIRRGEGKMSDEKELLDYVKKHGDWQGGYEQGRLEVLEKVKETLKQIENHLEVYEDIEQDKVIRLAVVVGEFGWVK